MTDGEIIKLYFDRDESAIRQTDAKYGAYLLKTAQDLTRDRRDSEECLNDTYMYAWNSIPPQNPSSLPAYLTVIIRRCALKIYRKEGRKKRIPEKLFSSIEDLSAVIPDKSGVDDQYEARESSRIINSYLETLDKRSHYIFMSRYFASRKVREIALKLGVSKSTVDKELARMKSELKEAFEKEGYTV